MYLKQKRLIDIEKRLVVAKRELDGGGKAWEFGISRGKLLQMGWINNKILQYGTETIFNIQ